MATNAHLNPTTATFGTEVLENKGDVLVEFWAPWCGPCRAFKPVVEAVGSERAGLQVAFVNVDEQPELGAQFGIQSIPALRLFRAGKVVADHVGAMPRANLVQWLDQQGA